MKGDWDPFTGSAEYQYKQRGKKLFRWYNRHMNYSIYYYYHYYQTIIQMLENHNSSLLKVQVWTCPAMRSSSAKKKTVIVSLVLISILKKKNWR